jgi:hypothetical protein
MKKLCVLAVLAATCGLASAVTITSPIQGTGALDGNSAYAWGLSISLAPGQSITTASLSFTDIKLTAANSTGKGILYSDLLNSTLTGVHTYTDNDAVGDYFAGHYTSANLASLGSRVFGSVGTMLSWTVNFDSTQLAALNNFLADGKFDIGFDPDCHYNVGCIAFTYTTTPVSTPDAATTVYVLGLVLLGLEVTRRQVAMAKK